MDDVDLGVDQLRVVDHPARGLDLGERRAAVRVVARIGAAGRDQVGLGEIEHLAVLAVDVHQRARGAGRAQHAQEGLVAEPELADREDLDARKSVPHQRRDLLQHGVARLGEDHVEAVVDVRPPLRLGLPRLDRLRQAVAPLLPGVVADRGHAAAGRRRRPRLEIVRGPHAAQIEIEVRVDVDAARHDHQPPRVDLLPVRGQALVDRRDAPAADTESAATASVAVATSPPRITRSYAIR